MLLLPKEQWAKAGNLPETISLQKSGSIEQKSTSTYQPSNNSTKFSLGSRGNVVLVHQLHVTLHASLTGIPVLPS